MAAARGDVFCQYRRSYVGAVEAHIVHTSASLADYRLGSAVGGSSLLRQAAGINAISIHFGDFDPDCPLSVSDIWYRNWRQQELAGFGTISGTALGVWQNPFGIVSGSLFVGSQTGFAGISSQLWPSQAAAFEIYCSFALHLGHGYIDVCSAKGFGFSAAVFLYGGVYDLYGYWQ